MSTRVVKASSFHSDLKAILPRLRVYALALTRDRDRADDLVQETVVKALAGRQSFRPGTCFSAWILRIQRNEFISGIRRLRPSVAIDDAVANALSHPPRQGGGLIMGEFLAAFAKLTADQRGALVLAVVDGQSYEEIARHAGVSVGTIKSRISRGRDTLERLLVDDETEQVARPRYLPSTRAPFKASADARGTRAEKLAA